MRHPEDGSGFRCYECGQVFPSMWGDTCNGCREKERRHREVVAALTSGAERRAHNREPGADAAVSTTARSPTTEGK